MSSWNGFEDGDSGSGVLLSSPPRSPFSAAFRTPRPAGIQSGVRDVPPDLSEHPEDLYDAIEVEFGKAMIHNPNKASHTGMSKRRRIYCGCLGECRTARCVCKKNGVGCTIYCHKRSGECPNKAEGSAYTQIAVIEQEQADGNEMQE